MKFNQDDNFEFKKSQTSVREPEQQTPTQPSELMTTGTLKKYNIQYEEFFSMKSPYASEIRPQALYTRCQLTIIMFP